MNWEARRFSDLSGITPAWGGCLPAWVCRRAVRAECASAAPIVAGQSAAVAWFCSWLASLRIVPFDVLRFFVRRC